MLQGAKYTQSGAEEHGIAPTHLKPSVNGPQVEIQAGFGAMTHKVRLQRAPLRGRGATLHEPVNEEDEACDRDQADEDPPARTARVMHPADGGGGTGNDRGKQSLVSSGFLADPRFDPLRDAADVFVVADEDENRQTHAEHDRGGLPQKPRRQGAERRRHKGCQR